MLFRIKLLKKFQSPRKRGTFFNPYGRMTSMIGMRFNPLVSGAPSSTYIAVSDGIRSKFQSPRKRGTFFNGLL